MPDAAGGEIKTGRAHAAAVLVPLQRNEKHHLPAAVVSKEPGKLERKGAV